MEIAARETEADGESVILHLVDDVMVEIETLPHYEQVVSADELAMMYLSLLVAEDISGHQKATCSFGHLVDMTMQIPVESVPVPALLVRAEAPGGDPAVEGAVTEHGPGAAVSVAAHKDAVGTGEDAYPVEGDIPAGQNLKGSAAEPEGEVTNDEIVALAYGQSTRGFPGHAQAHVVGICLAGIIRDPRYMVRGRL